MSHDMSTWTDSELHLCISEANQTIQAIERALKTSTDGKLELIEELYLSKNLLKSFLREQHIRTLSIR